MIIKLLLPLLRETHTTAAAVLGRSISDQKIWTLKNSHNNWHYCFHSTPARPKIPINAAATCKKHTTPRFIKHYTRSLEHQIQHTQNIYTSAKGHIQQFPNSHLQYHDWKLLVAYFKCHLWKGSWFDSIWLKKQLAAFCMLSFSIFLKEILYSYDSPGLKRGVKFATESGNS